MTRAIVLLRADVPQSNRILIQLVDDGVHVKKDSRSSSDVIDEAASTSRVEWTVRLISTQKSALPSFFRQAGLLLEGGHLRLVCLSKLCKLRLDYQIDLRASHNKVCRCA